MRGTVPKKEGYENNALYSDSTLAIEPDTGKLRWYRQHLQDDTWDLDYVHERLLIDLPVNGEPPKTGEKTINAAIVPRIGQPATTCPANPGARDWPATAFNPKNGLLYVPLNE